MHEIDSNASGTVDASTKTEYLNDAQSLTGYSQVLQETVIDPTTGEIQKRIVYAIGHDQISQTTIPYSGGVPQTPETLFFATDGHGSVRVLLDMAGAIASVAGMQQLFHYDAYGNALGFNPAQAATSYLYSGEQFEMLLLASGSHLSALSRHFEARSLPEPVHTFVIDHFATTPQQHRDSAIAKPGTLPHQREDLLG